MMAAQLPRGRFQDRISKRRKAGATMALTTTTTTSTSKSPDHLPVLIRAGPPPPARLSHVRLSIGGTTGATMPTAYDVGSTSRTAKSLPEMGVVGEAESKRRKKLRDVIAMMEMSKRPVKRKNDVETHVHHVNEASLSAPACRDGQRTKVLEAAKRRSKHKASSSAPQTNVDVDNVQDDIDNEEDKKQKAIATMGVWQSFVRKKKAFTRGRRSGFAGHLPIRKAGVVEQKNSQELPEPPKTLGKFRTVVKLIIYLLRLSKTYIFQESDARMVSLFSDIDAAKASDHYKIRGDLLYDITQFKALKSQMISNETKRILLRDAKKRSKKDIHHVMVELQQMKSITQYPVDMQRGLVANSWYEEYPTGRVISRYGRSPQAFYVILGGSVLHLEGDPNIPGRPVTSLNKGDMFGEQAIAHQGKHAYTVISKEPVQLMCLSPEDYCRIFLAGGLDNFSDLGDHSFVKSVCIFQHWPIHLLKNNHQQTRFQYYVHGTTIVEDSNKSGWIIIVKSGSCSVLKKLTDPTSTALPALAPIAKRKKSVVPTVRYKRDFIHPAETHQDMLARRLKELQRKRTRAVKNSRWQRYIKKPTNLIKIPLHDNPFEEPTESRDYKGSSNPLAVDLSRRYEDSLKKRVLPNVLGKTDDVIEETNPAADELLMAEDGRNKDESHDEEREEEDMDTGEAQPGELDPEVEIVTGGRKQSFSKGPFMTHRSSRGHLGREESKVDRTRKQSSSLSHRDGVAMENADRRSAHAEGLGPSHASRRNSLARRDSVVQRRSSTNRRDSMSHHDTHGGRESVTQDSGMTDLTEATHITDEQADGVNGGEEGELEEGDEDESGDETTTTIPPPPTHKFVIIDTLEKGGVFGVLDVAFGSQPSLSLVSNGAECIMVRKKFYVKHANDKAVWNITEKLRPYPDEDTLTRDLAEKLTWKDHRDATLKATALKLKNMRKRLADPRLQRPAAVVETYT